MDVTKSHAEIQRAYRSRLKQQNPELLRMRERENWQRQSLKKRSRLAMHSNAESDNYLQSHNMPMKHQEIRNYDTGNTSNEQYPVDVNEDISKDSAELAVKYPIHDLLKWLENVEVEDSVKYNFLKYIYREKENITDSPSAYTNGSTDAHNSFIHRNTDTSQCERQDLKRRQDTPNQVHDTKRIPIESPLESHLLPKREHRENAERMIVPLRRKCDSKTRNKMSKKTTKQTTKRKNMDLKRREHIKWWEPLCFDDDDE